MMKKLYYILGTLQAVTAIGAIPAGIGYLTDTSGQGMGTSTEILANSPLKSFLLPGLFLLIINGLANLGGSVLSFIRNRYAGHTGLVLGILLSLWIIIQVAWISMTSFLQLLFLPLGVVFHDLALEARLDPHQVDHDIRAPAEGRVVILL